MKHKFPLTTFFISSFYSRPKQTMLQVVLIIAFIYLYIQLTAANVAIYFLGDIQEYMLYNLVISNILVFSLISYLSISTVFHYHEFDMMASLPIKPERIVASKVCSSLIVPICISIVTQIPTLLFIVISMEFVEAVKLLLFLPISNLFTTLLLLFILSVINRFRHRFVSKVMYLFSNILAVSLVMIAFAVFVKQNLREGMGLLFSEIELSSISELKGSISILLNLMYETNLHLPFIGTIIREFTSSSFSWMFFFLIGLLIIISSLLFFLITKNIAINYFINGHTDISQTSRKKSRMYNIKSEWGYYLQRELWVIQSKAYFKMQIVLGLLFPPVISFILLITIQTGWLLLDTESVYFGKYFAYALLLLSCMNNNSGTPYSREGKYFYLSNYLPFNPRTIFFSKVIVASATSMIAIITSFLVYSLLGYMNMDSFMMMLIVLFLVTCYNLLAPIYDMKNPSTEWGNPSEAVKSNPNVLVSLCYGVPVIILIVLIHFVFLLLGISSFWSTVLILMLSVFFTFALIHWLSKTFFRSRIAS
ncbi:hypothetical protein [Psychrobacillus lasiicapitis]|uniref:Uncharacterized protein n=1 Tax=Psychrobacillus lasiicapitis TaxID=1636719 RepID=A0A544T4W3_9BACI|nr:hypothetical protein [Psychrobacillus lasiicapitis]TQR12456.1 hypothetical protein FG382_12575 [Psychrobacillus lasiicapitis]